MKHSKEEYLHQFNKFCKGTLMENLSIEYIDAGEDFLVCKMPITKNVLQPMGFLHGGATMALIETVGSSASMMHIDIEIEMVKGLEISANHIRSAVEGDVIFARAQKIHCGRTTHIWEVKVTDDQDRLISHGKVTNIILGINFN